MHSKNNLIKSLLISCVFAFAAPQFAFAADYTMGDWGPQVTEIQAKLQQHGYEISKVDGNFGSQTRAAVLAFQKDTGIEADGKVDKETFKKLLGKDMPALPARMTSKLGDMIGIAMRYRGVPYSFGGTTPYGFDCSGFTRYVFNQVGMSLPRMADEQYYAGTPIPKSQLAPGDLVFFETYEPGPSHVGIYIGNGQFIHASSSRGVTVSSIYDPYYWSPRYLGARRY